MEASVAMLTSKKVELSAAAIEKFKAMNADKVEASDFKAHPWTKVNCLLRAALGMDKKDSRGLGDIAGGKLLKVCGQLCLGMEYEP